MNLNKKRHKLLELLSIQLNNFNLKKSYNNTQAIDFETIYKELNCTEDELEIITSELYTCDEIDYYRNKFVGLFAKKNGLTAFSNEKYLNINRKNRIENIKSFVQIVIPVFALIVAILSFTMKFDNLKKQYKKELQEVKLLLLKQQKRIEVLESNTETNQKAKKK